MFTQYHILMNQIYDLLKSVKVYFSLLIQNQNCNVEFGTSIKMYCFISWKLWSIDNMDDYKTMKTLLKTFIPIYLETIGKEP